MEDGGDLGGSRGVMGGWKCGQDGHFSIPQPSDALV